MESLTHLSSYERPDNVIFIPWDYRSIRSSTATIPDHSSVAFILQQRRSGSYFLHTIDRRDPSLADYLAKQYSRGVFREKDAGRDQDASHTKRQEYQRQRFGLVNPAPIHSQPARRGIKGMGRKTSEGG